VPRVGQTHLAWLKHAFAIDPPGPAEPDEAQAQLVDRICREIVRRRLTTPAMLAIEMGRPLNYLSAQVLTFFQPFLAIVGDAGAYERFTSFLEQRGSLDYIAARIEALEAGVEPRAAERVSGPRDKE
jgi:hypothetical protein